MPIFDRGAVPFLVIKCIYKALYITKIISSYIINMMHLNHKSCMYKYLDMKNKLK